MLPAYARFIVRHFYLFIFIVSLISSTLTLIPLLCHDIPSFTDPVAGFETRGTTLAHRFVAWENLIEETRPSRRLAVNPQEIEDQIRMNETFHNRSMHAKPKLSPGKSHKNRTKNKKKKVNTNIGIEYTMYDTSHSVNYSKDHVHWGYGKNVSMEDEKAVLIKDHTRKQWITLKELERGPGPPLFHNLASGTCGPPVSDYAHLVIKSMDNTSLLSYENVEKMCKLQSILIEAGEEEYHKLCQRSTHSEELCCPVWSVPNYIALMSGKYSCENLSREDVNMDKFLFERLGKDLGTGSRMPLRWVWGVKAIDNGNHMDPASRGKLVFEEDFSISEPESQLWLLQFCDKLKAQPFFQQTLGPLLPNCFIESFKKYMDRRCVDSFDKIDRSPCCEVSEFPYEKEVFDLCIIKAMTALYQTPRELFLPGVAGPKFLRSARPPKIVALVVEFESVVPYSMSYKTMQDFFTKAENWTQHELETAPPGMKSGWFLSDLQFYDLQRTLASGTVIALLLSATLGFVVLIPATLNFVISLCALVAMIFSSTVTITILVWYGWKLNVLESVAISTSAGLAVDFSLHYALSYTNAIGTKFARVKYALSASAGPTAAAALTTGFAGIFLLSSKLLPYSQIGTFLALIMSVSWTYATFFLCSLLYIVGAESTKESSKEERKSVSRVSSICSGVPNLESHELEHLADSSRTNMTQSQSPPSTASVTTVLHEDLDISISNHSHARMETISST
ncbi:unnamed protein product [Plutella xylostella]|uniref:(diamondback moth) hypothetical protein n=1 Tax=Plutella xylostella TaxID=51655 RepID=A0A8S4FXD0_PLUXY|nr:unnamed protein product [Plutella xylostella]